MSQIDTDTDTKSLGIGPFDTIPIFPSVSGMDHYVHYVFVTQAVRDAWKADKGRKGVFFMGKNRVMSVGLGRDEAEEYNDHLHRVSRLLRGANRGLMFTNEDPLKVEEFFAGHGEPDYARTNGVATEDVVLPEGPLPQVYIE